MTKTNFLELINFLQKNHKVYGPVLDRSGRLLVKEIKDPEKIILNGRLTHYSFKNLFLPSHETLFDYDHQKLKEPNLSYKKQAIVGMTISDLEALELYDQVFVKDPYYQERRRQTLVIGYSLAGKKSFSEELIYEQQFEEDILEHVKFDVFCELRESGTNDTNNSSDFCKVFAGSENGIKILDGFGYKDYENIKYVGPIREPAFASEEAVVGKGGLDKTMMAVYNKMRKGYAKKVWEDIGKRCIECGQCTLVCPTCYCFRIDDEPSLDRGKGKRVRCWDACMYHEFSEISGKTRLLKSTEQRMWFWFYHKFVRIPEKYKIPGCVKCGRCSRVCPVDIDFMKVLQDILKS